MIIFIKTGGAVAYVSDENINLGSDKANSLFVVAPYASASSVCVVFKLPNGKTLGPGFVENQGSVTFYPEDSVYVMQKNGSIPGYFFDGQSLSAWSYDIQSALTGVSGTLGIQLFIFADGRCISTDLINVPINVGVNNLVTPSIDPTGDVYQQILYYLTSIYDEAETAVSSAAAAANSATAAANSATAAEGSAVSAKDYAEVTAPQKATEAATEAANNVLNTVNNRLDNAENRLDNVDYILEQFGAVKAQVDSSAALVKSIPARSDLFAYINSVGGKTEKYNQLLANGFWHVGETVPSGVTIEHNGGTIKNNGDGTYTLNGTFSSIYFNLFKSTKDYFSEEFDLMPILPDGATYATLCVSLKNEFPGVGVNFSISVRDTAEENGTYVGDQWGDFFLNSNYNGVQYGRGRVEKKYISTISFNYGNSITLNNYIFAPMFNLGTTPFPWQSPADPFTGLRSGKVTALKVYGANLLNYNEWKTAVINDRNGTISSSVEWLSDGFSVSALSTGGYVNSVYKVNVIPNTTVSVMWDVVSNTNAMVYVFVNGNSLGTSPIRTAVSYSKGIATLPLPSDAEYITFRFSGADNKPTIYENIRIAYTDKKIPYSPYKEVEYSIPLAIQNLEGYGEGNPDNVSEYNTVDFENKLFKRNGLIVNNEWTSLTPTVTNISANLEGFDPVIPVEPGGQIEFANDYNYDVPSTVTYNIIQEA